MPKTVLLLRHAKSSRENPETADFDRPVTRRGRRDAPRMGKWMHEAGLKPDLVLCSDARRARETWTGLAETLGSAAPVLFERGLYMVSAKALRNRLRRKFPTAALARLDFNLDDWRKLEPGSGRLALFVTPADLD